MRRLSVCLAAAFALASLSACDAADASSPPATAFDPSTVDYDALTRLDYETEVRPLLAARNVLAPAATDAAGDPADYALDALVMAGPSGFVVPFDAAGSLMTRFVTDLPDSAAIPFPNLRRLEPDERRFVSRWIEAGARAAPGGAVPFADAPAPALRLRPGRELCRRPRRAHDAHHPPRPLRRPRASRARPTARTTSRSSPAAARGTSRSSRARARPAARS